MTKCPPPKRTPPSLVMDASPPPNCWYLQSSNTGQRFLVEATLFTVPGSLPSGCWLDRVFGPQALARPAPLCQENGLPVYGVPIPGLILEEMLHGIRFPAMLPKLAREVPKRLVHHFTQALWQHYFEYYLGVPIPAAKRGREEDDEGPAAKRARRPRNVFLRRAAETLAANIKADHPKWFDFRTGIRRDLVSHFTGHTASGPHYVLEVPGDDEVVRVNGTNLLGNITPDEKPIFEEAFVRAIGFPDASIAVTRIQRALAPPPELRPIVRGQAAPIVVGQPALPVVTEYHWPSRADQATEATVELRLFFSDVPK